MALFSFLNKSKQEATADDRGYYSRDDDPAATFARSRRASSAGDPAPDRADKPRVSDDPVLPEKKRARRRLVGAVALALAVAVVLPMVLDSEPKPLASDIAIQIPSRDKAAPLPLPAAPGMAPAALPADSLDVREQFVEPAKVPPREAAPTLPAAMPVPAPVLVPAPARQAEPKLLPKQELKAVELKAMELNVVERNAVERKAAERKAAELKAAELKATELKVTELKAAERKAAELKTAELKAAERKAAELKAAESRLAAKPAARAEEKTVPKPMPAAPEASRALAILEGKSADKTPAPDAARPKFVVQVAALATQEKVAELQDRLRQMGISSLTHKVSTGAGERIIQVQIGPFVSRDEADRMRARIDQAGLKGSMVKPDGK